MVTASPWWRILVDGKYGGARWIVWVVVGRRLGEILVGLFGTDAVTPVGVAVPS